MDLTLHLKYGNISMITLILFHCFDCICDINYFADYSYSFY